MRFVEILCTATVVTGLIVVLDHLFLRPKRLLNVLPSNNRSFSEPWWVEYSKSFFPVLLLVFLLRSFVAEPFRIPSGSMHPTLLEGDFILVNKYSYGLRTPFTGHLFFNRGSPKRGDIIVFKHEENGKSLDLIKRLIGLPGDHIEYKNQKIYVNGVLMKQTFDSELNDWNALGMPAQLRKFTEIIDDRSHDILIETSAISGNYHYAYQDVVVPANHYFVMGDNRNNSKDSRFWGFVRDQDVQGKAVAIWMSWDAEAPLLKSVRFDRFTAHLQ